MRQARPSSLPAIWQPAPDPYDVLRIGAWALVIFRVLLVLTALIRYWAAQARR